MSFVFIEAGKWKLREEGKRAIKSLSAVNERPRPWQWPCSLVLYFSCSGEKHGTITRGSLRLSLVSPNHLFSLVFQQEECQRILQPGKRLSKQSLTCTCCSRVWSNCGLCRFAAVCAVGVSGSERDGLIEEGAGGRAEAQWWRPEESFVVPRANKSRGAQWTILFSMYWEQEKIQNPPVNTVTWKGWVVSAF